MKRAIVIYQYNGTDNYVNICGDKLKIDNKTVIVYEGQEIVGIFNLENVISAHIASKEK